MGGEQKEACQRVAGGHRQARAIRHGGEMVALVNYNARAPYDFSAIADEKAR